MPQKQQKSLIDETHWLHEGINESASHAISQLPTTGKGTSNRKALMQMQRQQQKKKGPTNKKKGAKQQQNISYDNMEEKLFQETLQMHQGMALEAKSEKIIKSIGGSWNQMQDNVLIGAGRANDFESSIGMVGLVETLDNYDAKSLMKYLPKDSSASQIEEQASQEQKTAASASKKKAKKSKKRKRAESVQKNAAAGDEEKTSSTTTTTGGSKQKKKKQKTQPKKEEAPASTEPVTTPTAQTTESITTTTSEDDSSDYVVTQAGTKISREEYEKLMKKVEKRKKQKEKAKLRKQKRRLEKQKLKEEASVKTTKPSQKSSNTQQKKKKKATQLLGSSDSIKAQIESVHEEQRAAQEKAAQEEDAEETTQGKASDSLTNAPVVSASKKKVSNKKIRKNWQDINLPDAIMKHIIRIGFNQPTEVQKQGIPVALHKKRNLVVSSQTGSGKTLVFGLPIIARLLTEKKPIRKKLRALIIVPSRELCVQVYNMLKEVSLDTGVRCEMALGGFFVDKHRKKIGKKRPEILVCTPARLWALIHTHRLEHLMDMSALNFLVFDEADLMVKFGHYQELTHILQFIEHLKNNKRVQKIITSATLTLPSRWSHERANTVDPRDDWDKEATDDRVSLKKLMDMMHFDESNSEVVDLTPETAIADTLIDTQISCLSVEKQSYLYYLLYYYKGRTIIFCNSIYTVQEIFQLMKLLKIRIFQLHGGMSESQRLNSLEKFLKHKDAALVATDAVARGIDIPLVSQVVHFEIPTSADTYIHRCGRSGRAFNNGLSVALITEKDKRSYKIICGATKRPEGLPLFPVRDNILQDVHKRVKIAWQMVLLEKDRLKKSHEVNWYKRMADEMDIILDEEEFPDIFEKEDQLKHDKRWNSLEKQLSIELKNQVGKSRFEGQSDFITAETTNFDFLKPQSRDARNDFFSTYMQQHKAENGE